MVSLCLCHVYKLMLALCLLMCSCEENHSTFVFVAGPGYGMVVREGGLVLCMHSNLFSFFFLWSFLARV